MPHPRPGMTEKRSHFVMRALGARTHAFLSEWARRARVAGRTPGNDEGGKGRMALGAPLC